MKCAYLFTFVIALVSIYKTLAQFVQHTGNGPFPVTILYSSLCPDSKKFFREQLGPAYEHIGNYIQLKLVPFGKASSLDDGRNFECQRGPAECLGNKVQSCAIHHAASQLQALRYVLCEMEEAHGSKGSLECASRFELPQAEIAECVMTDLGTSLQLIAEQDTKPLQLDFIPSIFVGGRFDKNYQDYALNYFKQFVCQLIFSSDCPPMSS